MAENILKPKNYDLRKLLKPFENKWVALTPDNKKVVASGNTLKEAASRIREKDREVMFMKVLPFKPLYVPLAL